MCWPQRDRCSCFSSECEAQGEFAERPEAHLYCHQNCLGFPSHCPEDKCRCFWEVRRRWRLQEWRWTGKDITYTDEGINDHEDGRLTWWDTDKKTMKNMGWAGAIEDPNGHIIWGMKDQGHYDGSLPVIPGAGLSSDRIPTGDCPARQGGRWKTTEGYLRVEVRNSAILLSQWLA